MKTTNQRFYYVEWCLLSWLYGLPCIMEWSVCGSFSSQMNSEGLMQKD